MTSETLIERFVVQVAAKSVLAVLLISSTAASAPVATYRLSPGWATFGVALPVGAARDALQIGTLRTQTDVKTTWPDGSIRFAVVTAKVPAQNSYDITPGTPDLAVFTPAHWPSSTHVDFAMPDGTVYVATLTMPLQQSDAWLKGPLLQDSRVWVTPVTSRGEAHRRLRVIFDVRSYSDDAHRIDIAVENCISDDPAATSIRYDVSITVDNVVVYTRRRATGGSALVSVGDSKTQVSATAHGLQKNDVIRLTSGSQAGEDREVGYITGPNTFTLYAPGWSAAQKTPVSWERPGVIHRYLTRWRKVFPVDLTESTITPDVQPFYSARALFPMRSDYVKPARTNANLAERRFDIGGVGDFRVYMSDHGGRPELAPYSDWVALFLMFKDPAQWEYVRRTHGDLAASWPVHARTSDGQIPTIFTDYRYWFDYRGQPGHRPAGDISGLSDYGTGGSSVGWQIADIAHQPSLAYVPYLFTGDRFYLDEMIFWGNYTLADVWPGDGIRGYTRGSEGYLRYSLPARGVAWALRNLADVAAYTPDADPWKTRFSDVIRNNLSNLDSWADDLANQTTIAPLFQYTYGIKNPLTGREFVQISPWQHDFLAVSLEHVWQQELHPSLGRRFFRHLVSERMSMGLDNAASWPREDPTAPAPTQRCAPFYAYVGEVINGAWVNYRSWADVYAANVSMIHTSNNAFVPLLGYYATDTYAFLLVARRHGYPNAQASLDWLLSQMLHESAGSNEFDRHPGWAIDVAGRPVPDAEVIDLDRGCVR